MVMIEFVIPGIPRTIQTKSPKSRDDWKEKVKTAARAKSINDNFIGEKPLSASIVYFFEGETQLDVDGIGKLLLDSLIGILYDDDSQAEQVLLRKTRKEGLTILNPPLKLVEALEEFPNFVFVKFGDGPKHEELPQ